MPHPDLDTLPTPALLVDEDRMQANIDRMAQHLNRLGMPLRPHLKTCKNIEIARRLLAGQPGGAAVSTLAEADYFFAHGIDDLLYAVGIAPGKLQAVADRMARGMKLSLVLDHPATARAVAEAATQLGLGFRLLLEIDADGQRAGFQPQSNDLLAAADILADAGCKVAGVMVHAGGAYACADLDCIRHMAEQERQAAVLAADRLRHAGHAVEQISIGSTPTASFGDNFDGISEVRAGVHVFHDLVMAGLGVCQIDDIALSVLTEVIGHRPDTGQVIVDAGWMALSRDRGRAPGAPDYGFGLVRGLNGADLGAVIVTATNQEHGIIGRADGQALALEAFPIGSRWRILPNHACATAGQYRNCWLLGRSARPAVALDRVQGW
jgi:D-serine deaminase-like pyridoxal phosphate-dependent protein